MKTLVTTALLLAAGSALAGTGAPHAHDEIDVEALKRWTTDAATLEVVDTAPWVAQDAVVAALGRAVAAWNGVGTGPLLTVTRATEEVGHPVAFDGLNRVGVWSDGAWPYPEMAGAVTLVYAARGSTEIAEVDIALNPAFAWTVDPLGDEGKYDLENVLVHEVGHALGLPDVKDQREASMFYVILRGETLKRDLSEDDEGMLLALYEGLVLEEDHAGGCSASGTPTPIAALAGLLALARRTVNRRSSK